MFKISSGENFCRPLKTYSKHRIFWGKRALALPRDRSWLSFTVSLSGLITLQTEQRYSSCNQTIQLPEDPYEVLQACLSSGCTSEAFGAIPHATVLYSRGWIRQDFQSSSSRMACNKKQTLSKTQNLVRGQQQMSGYEQNAQNLTGLYDVHGSQFATMKCDDICGWRVKNRQTWTKGLDEWMEDNNEQATSKWRQKLRGMHFTLVSAAKKMGANVLEV